MVCPIPEKEAAGWPLLPDYGHYMGLKMGLFFKIHGDMEFLQVIRKVAPARIPEGAGLVNPNAQLDHFFIIVTSIPGFKKNVWVVS
jgi:hypothetical protein